MLMNYRRTRAEIDPAALQHNLRWIRQHIGAAPLLGIVKADGYGHGVGAASRAIEEFVDAYGVGFTDEALALRQAYPDTDKKVLVLEGCFSESELQLCVQHRLSVVVHSLLQLEQLEQASLTEPLDVWLKVDTGMHRLGIELKQADEFYQRLKASNNVSDVVLMSHLANADSGKPLNHYQRQRFDELKQQFPELQYSFHNSAAILNPQLRGQLTSTDWVRTGLLMYGVNPSDLTEVQAELVPAMTLTAPVIGLHRLKKGDAVGYGSHWVAAEDSRIATVAIGYADGYPRQCENGTPTYINGAIAPLVGRVSMDMITIDVSHIPNVRLGDKVELWGRNVDVREVARCADTISWHLLTGTSVRVPRVVI